MKIYIISIILSFASSLYAHDTTKVKEYHHYIHKSKELLSKGDYLNSIENAIHALETNVGYGGDAFVLLFSFFEKIPIKNNEQYFNQLSEYISLLAMNGYGKNSIKNTIKLVNTHGLNYVSDSLKPTLYLYSNQLDYNILVNRRVVKHNYKQWKKNYAKNLNHSMLNRLKRIDRFDQHGRLKASNEELNKKDSLVFIKLTSLILENGGFPSINEVGEDGYDIISTCLIHMNLERLVTFLPKLETIIKNGQAFIGNDIIYSIDRSAIEQGKYLIFKNGEYNILYDTTMFHKFYAYSSMGAFTILDKNEFGKFKYLYPLHPDIKQGEANIVRSKFYVPSVQQSKYIWKNKISNIEAFKREKFQKKNTYNTILISNF